MKIELRCVLQKRNFNCPKLTDSHWDQIHRHLKRPSERKSNLV
jgi:hypothetical protein